MSNKRSEKAIEQIENFIIDEIGNYLDSIGAKHLLGRIFGLLIVQNKPISLSDIAHRLNVTKPAVSTTLQAGVTVDIFKKSIMPEFPRENFYEVSKDFIELIVEPGIKKFASMHRAFERALDLANEDSESNNDSKELKELIKKISYLEKSFGIFLEEYKNFSVVLKKKIDKI